MKKPRSPKPARSKSPSERYGDLWGLVYVAVIVILVATLVGKALLKKG